MKYEYNLLEEKFQKIPKEIQLIMTSSDTMDKIENIGNKHGLLLDQISTLSDITSYVMLGIIPSKKFAESLSKEAEIDEGKAINIVNDVDKEIFQSIKSSIQKIQEEHQAEDIIENTNNQEKSTESARIINLSETPTPATPINKTTEKIGVPSYIPKPQDIKKTQDIPTYQNPKPISDIEKVGQFTIENKTITSSNQYKEENINKENILKQIEGDSYKPPMIDHLLNTSVINKEQIVKKEEMSKEENKNITENKESNSYSVDPYREQI